MAGTNGKESKREKERERERKRERKRCDRSPEVGG